MQMLEPGFVCWHVLSQPRALSGRTKVLSELCATEKKSTQNNASPREAHARPAVFPGLRSIILFISKSLNRFSILIMKMKN
jgi:hypothetical protein